MHSPLAKFAYLLHDLQDHNGFFDELVALVVPHSNQSNNNNKPQSPSNDKGVISSSDNNKKASSGSSSNTRKEKDAPSPSTKYYRGQHADSKEAQRNQRKAAKRAKYDPDETNNAESEQQDVSETAIPSNKNNKNNQDVTKTSAVETSSTSAASPHQSRIEALRAKLRAKLADQEGRDPTDPTVVSKRAARRAEKQRRREQAIAAAKKKTSTNTTGSQQPRFNVTLSTSTANNGALGADGNINSSNNNNNTNGEDPVSLTAVDYGNLVGLNSQKPKNYLETNKALANMNKAKSLERMLAEAQAKQKRLEELKQQIAKEQKQKQDQDGNGAQSQAKAQYEKLQWKDALQEAAGTRVKDDPALLKKQLQRKAAKRSKSQKAWKERLETVQQTQEERQATRNKNLQARRGGVQLPTPDDAGTPATPGAAAATLTGKATMGRNNATPAATKGSANNSKQGGRRNSRAGFEGRKQGFLNNKKEQ